MQLLSSTGGGSAEQAISTYHAFYFETVAAAIEFCDRLVPFVVPSANGRPLPGGRAAVWFHVPARSTRTTRGGCYLFLSVGALAAAQRAGLEAEQSGELPRGALPTGSALVLGEDLLDREMHAKGDRPAARRADRAPAPPRPPYIPAPEAAPRIAAR